LPFDLSLAGRQPSDGALTVAFTVGFEYERADLAAKVANELVTLILSEDIRNRTSKAAETTQFLARESDRLQQELTAIDQVLSDFKQKFNDELPERIPFQTASLERAQSDIKELDREINELSESKRLLQLEMSLRSAAQTGDPNNNGQSNPLRSLEILKAEYTQKSAIYSPSHPEIRALKSQIEALEKQLLSMPTVKPEGDQLSPQELQRLDLNSRIITEKIETIDRKLKIDQSQKAAIAGTVLALNSILEKAPDVQANLAVLVNKRDDLQKNFEQIGSKLAAARLGEQLEKDQQAERFQVIEQPITPHDPVRPNRQKIITFGFFLAGLAGVGSVMGLEVLNQSIRTSRDIVTAVNQHPIAVIPYIATQAEGRRKVGRLMLAAILAIVVGLLGLAAIHFFYMPIDVLVEKVLMRLNF
jgi:polysaccharide biosynthesis transport protein